MPKRKGITFKEKDVSHVSVGKPVNVGNTKTVRYLEELQSISANPKELNPYFHHGKIHFRKGFLRKGKGKAQRVFLKPVFGTTREEQKSNAHKEVAFFNKMRKAGLPVPKAGVVIHREQAYIAVEPFLRGASQRSVLTPINTKHGYSKPWFLRKLSLRKDSALIKNLAKDLATIANSNISTEYFDLHGFYRRKDGSLKRVIMDTNHLRNWKFTSGEVKSVCSEIKQVWKGKRYEKERELFRKTLVENIENPDLRARFDFAMREISLWQSLKTKFF